MSDSKWIFSSASWQHKLEGALLALGQFQHALDELLAWLTHTKGLLSEQKPVGGDPKAIEIELAKHHVRTVPACYFCVRVFHGYDFNRDYLTLNCLTWLNGE